MVHTGATTKVNLANVPAVGTVIDQRYELLKQLTGSPGGRRFRARDLSSGSEVELVISDSDGDPAYRIHFGDGDESGEIYPARGGKSAVRANRRAMEAFAQRVALTGVSIQRNNALIFQGFDRKLRREVRVVIEPAE